jgi:hypothetical protein
MPTINLSRNNQGHRLGSEQGYCLLNSTPVDIWEDIFFQCLPLPDDWNASTDRPHCSTQTAPLLLRQICRKWRKVAIAQPNLWCYLKVVISQGKTYPPAPLVSQWLEMSGCLPLTLLLYQETGSAANQRAVRDVLELYRRYIPRWKNIRLELAGLDFGETLAFQQCRAPLLEHLYLKSWPITKNPENAPLQVMPRLRTLSLSCMLVMDSLQEPCLPRTFGMLRSISIDTVMSVGAALQILGYCQNITQCFLGIERISDDLPDTRIVQTTLQLLELRIDLEDLPCFLDYATLPALTDLVIHGQPERESWPQTKFNDFLARSGVHLLSLTLHNTSILGSQLIALLLQPALYTLVELVIDDDTDWISDACVTSHTLELLSLDMSTHDDHLPDLKRLKIRLYSFENKKLVDMVESRWRCNQERRLRNLEVHLYPACSGKDLKRLSEFQKEGLELILLD